MKRSLALVMLLVIFLQPGWLETVWAQDSRPVVVLDPGHGWYAGNDKIDSGAVNGDLVEKDIALDVARHTQSFLSRCPVDVVLTRRGDDSEHTLNDVADIVNGHKPTVGLSIHVNSASGNPSGTESWYTVGGHDDENSQRLSTLLVDRISGRLSIPNRGIKPETQNRHGGLYVHQWQAPSALVEIAFLQGDARLLGERRRDFGRAIAQAVLEYLGLPASCADGAASQTVAIATCFPGETLISQIHLMNDGLVAWQADGYSLGNLRNPYGAEPRYPLPGTTEVGQIATWEVPATAPSRPGIYRQAWQLQRGNQSVGPQVTAVIVVVPAEARELKEDIDRQIEELRQRGEQEIESFVEELEQQALEWVTEEVERQLGGLADCLKTQSMMIGLAVLGILWLKKRRG